MFPIVYNRLRSCSLKATKGIRMERCTLNLIVPLRNGIIDNRLQLFATVNNCLQAFTIVYVRFEPLTIAYTSFNRLQSFTASRLRRA